MTRDCAIDVNRNLNLLEKALSNAYMSLGQTHVFIMMLIEGFLIKYHEIKL